MIILINGRKYDLQIKMQIIVLCWTVVISARSKIAADRENNAENIECGIGDVALKLNTAINYPTKDCSQS